MTREKNLKCSLCDWWKKIASAMERLNRMSLISEVFLPTQVVGMLRGAENYWIEQKKNNTSRFLLKVLMVNFLDVCYLSETNLGKQISCDNVKLWCILCANSISDDNLDNLIVPIQLVGNRMGNGCIRKVLIAKLKSML